jgi:K+-sensing histidine kinase KdpD
VSSAAPQLDPQPPYGAPAKGRSPLAHLLHALNQPLTGLQCSLELAVAGPHPTDQYIRTLRESLELTGRMRILVEAIRELSDLQPADAQPVQPARLDTLLREVATDLLPVAETKGVRLVVISQAALVVRADRRDLETPLFRLLESALSLARAGSDLEIGASLAPEHARLVVAWSPGPLPEHSPFSRPELGLLIAQAGLKQSGAEWTRTQAGTMEVCSLRLPLVAA